MVNASRAPGLRLSPVVMAASFWFWPGLDSLWDTVWWPVLSWARGGGTMSERVGNVTRSRYEQIVAEARELVAQVAPAQFALGDKALEIEPMRPVGGSMPNGTDDLFTVEESLAMFADDIGVAAATVTDWRWVASRWPEGTRRDGVAFSVHRILASISDQDERWAQIEDPPFNRSGRRGWTTDGAKRLVGQRVDRPVSVEEKVRAVTDLTRDDEVAGKVAAELLRRPAAAAQIAAADWGRVAQELTRDDEVAKSVTTELLRRPRVARETLHGSWSTGPSSTTPMRPASGFVNAPRRSAGSSTPSNTWTWSDRATATSPPWAGWSRACGTSSSEKTNARVSAGEWPRSGPPPTGSRPPSTPAGSLWTSSSPSC